MFFTSCNDKSVLPEQLPEQVQTFVKESFPSQTIVYAEKDWGFLGSEYEVTLTDGTRVDFDNNDVWEKISCNTGIPMSLLPATVASYVNSRFPGIAVVEVSKKSYGFKVELANDIDVKLNEQGALIEMDD
jgi:hypothetical protein